MSSHVRALANGLVSMPVTKTGTSWRSAAATMSGITCSPRATTSAGNPRAK